MKTNVMTIGNEMKPLSLCADLLHGADRPAHVEILGHLGRNGEAVPLQPIALRCM